MAKAGFYNDNEYRAYPFIEKRIPEAARQAAAGVVQISDENYAKLRTAIHSTIVDAGFILGIDCDTARPAVAEQGVRVWLKKIAVAQAGGAISVTFGTTATDALITFEAGLGADEWRTYSADGTVIAGQNCRPDHWRGFLVISGSSSLVAVFEELAIAVSQETGKRALTFSDELFEFEIEPGRLQNTERSYLRSITVGNRARIQVPACGENSSGVDNRPVIVNGTCITGPITLEEGYNCQISQITRSKTFTFSARVGAGAQKGAEYCTNYGEIPLEQNEEKPAGSKFYSGGPACDELLYTINGVIGKNVSIIPGAGITISVEDNKIVVGTRGDLVSDCAPLSNPEQ